MAITIGGVKYIRKDEHDSILESVTAERDAMAETLATYEHLFGKGWKRWDGGDGPPEDTKDESIDVVFHDNSVIVEALAERWEWDHEDSPTDIIGYRVREDR